MLYEEKIKKILEKRGISTESEIRDFLNPSLSNFHDPSRLAGMKDAGQRISQAINENQSILIYGDYDADGICSVSMLYLFLKSKGIEANVFIPNRHTDGYGLSEETIDYLVNTYFPDLVITVDTGISAHNEVEMLKDCGVDVIVTDHHEPPEALPDCIIVDPKCEGQDYPFNGLSGAGVVFKIIQYMGGLDEAMQLVDICAISTIGDIVPLLDENRIITKFGLEKMNAEEPRPAIAYLKKFLKIEKLNSTDITFKLVPRLNACGRMDSAFKGFEFLIGEDEETIKSKFAEIEHDNEERLRQSQEIQEEINFQLIGIDLNVQPAIFVKSDNINLGLIGIVASKLCGQYSRPVFVFTVDDDGNYKASIRSIEGVDVFSLLDKHRDLLIDVGGHSMAGGLTIAPENYDIFKKTIQAEIKVIYDNLEVKNTLDYDAEISENDINLNFAKAIEQLEPFGFCNPKPVLLLKCDGVSYEPMKSFRHFRAITPKKHEIVSFFGEKFRPIFAMPGSKNIFLNIEVDTFYKCKKAKATLKDVYVEPSEIINSGDEKVIKYMEMIFNTIATNKSNYIKKISSIEECDKYLKNKSGTMVVTDDFHLAKDISKKYKIRIATLPSGNGESVVYYNPVTCTRFEELTQYKNMIFVDGGLCDEEFGSINANTFVVNKKQHITIDKSREVFAKCYKLLLSRIPNAGNDIIELAKKIRGTNDEISLTQLAFTIFVSAELGFINYKKSDIVELSHVAKKEKTDLGASKFFNLI